MPRPEVFLSHASADAESVKVIARQLQQHAVPTWLDEWNLIPGEPWVDALGQALKECSGCVVFLGPSGAAPWHNEEVRSALDRAVRDRSFRVIPVLLPGTRRERLSHLPGFLANRHWVDFAKGLDHPDAIHRLVCGLQGKEPGAPTGASYVPGRNPYRGLRVFDVDDAPLFFGRQVLTEELLAKLGPESRSRFISIVGPSGSGKSSLARAGLLASLKAGGLPGSAGWPQVIVRPGAFPLESLALGVGSKLALGVDPSDLVRRFGAGEEALHREVGLALQGRPEHRAVLLVDQAEEAFTGGARDIERAAFFANLVYAATVRTGQTLVVLAFRSDFYSRFAEHRQLAVLVSENQLLVPSMSEDELREAIALPAERFGRPLRPAVVDELVRDARGQSGSLPLIEHALAQLWERPEPVLGIEEYRSIGGIAGALNSRAEEVFGALTSSQQATCRRLFLRLIQTGADALDTRRRVREAELPADQREVSQAFAAEGVHLLTWSREGDHQFLEVAHEELIRRWDRLQEWGHQDRLGQRLHRRLTMAANEWNARKGDSRDESFLYHGAALEEVEKWLALLPEDERLHLLNSDELAFLEQSRAARDRTRLDQERRAREAEELAEKREALRAAEQHRRQEAEISERRVRNRAAAALALACLVAIAAAVAINSAIRAEQQRAVALSRELTAVVAAKLDGDPQLNLALLKQAYQLAPTDEVFQMLTRWSDARGRVDLRGHAGPVSSAAFSPDGLRVVTASADGTARLWDAATGKPLTTLSGHLGPVSSAAFSPDGLRVVTAGADTTARLWDAATGKLLFTFSGHSKEVQSAVFSPDGTRILTTSHDLSVRLWDVTTGKTLAALFDRSDLVRTAVFSPDGLRILFLDGKGAQFWEVATGRILDTGWSGYRVSSVAFSPEGLRVVTASNDGEVKVREVATGETLATFTSDLRELTVDLREFNSTSFRSIRAPLHSAEFSPDGLRVVFAGDNKTAQVWDMVTGRPLAILSGHSDRVRAAAFSPNGLRVVTASDDNTARVWDVPPTSKQLADPSSHSGDVLSAEFSPDGLRVVSAGDDKTARLWDAVTGKPLATLSGHSRPVHGAVFGPDGSRLLTASTDSTARLWDAVTGKLLVTLSGHSNGVSSAVFSPDGSRILTASGDKTARLWDAVTGKVLATLSGHSGLVSSAVFSPNGLRIVTSSVDKTARLWDAASGKPLATLPGHSGPVYRAVFSPNSLRVVTSSADKTARLWDAASGEPLAILSGHSGPVESVAFSPDGLRIVTASGRAYDAKSFGILNARDDHAVRVWDAATGKPLAILSGRSGPVGNVAFSSDGLRVVIVSDDGTTGIWNVATGKPLASLSDGVIRAAFSPDGLRLVTAAGRGMVRVWDAATGKPLATLSDQSPMQSAAFSSDGLRVMTTSASGAAQVWKAVTGELLATVSDPTHLNLSDSYDFYRQMRNKAFSPDGLRVITASEDGTARVWDMATGKPLATLSGHSSRVTNAAFSPDGLRVTTSSEDGTARVWDAATGKPLATLSGHSGRAVVATFSQDGLRIITIGDNRTIRIWDAITSNPIATGDWSSFNGRANGGTLSPDGLRIVTTSYDSPPQIWSVATGKSLATLSGHSREVRSAVFSPDGLRVVTASEDGTARIWDAATGKSLATLSGHSDRVSSATFSPDGFRVVTASMDKTARVWDAAAGKSLATFSGYSRDLRSAVFSPDSLRVVITSDDGTTFVWQEDLWAPRSKQLELLDTGRELTSDERRTYLHE